MAKEVKVVDVRFPGKREAREKQKLQNAAVKKASKAARKLHVPAWTYAAALVFVSAVAAFGILQVFFSSADVVIRPQVRGLSTEVQLAVSTQADQVSIDELTIPARLFVKEAQATRLFPATGTSVGEERAQGLIRVFNERSSPQTLVANTRFLSEGGKLFRSSERVVVPAAVTSGGSTVPGTLDVAVTAAEAGPEYNIGSSSFSLPGLAGSSLYTLVYGKSFDPMEGGSRGETQVVKETDILKAKEQLISQLTDQARSEITAELPESYVLPENAYVTEVVKAESQASVGTPVSEFNYAATLRLSALAYDREDLKEVALSLLGLQVAEGERLSEEKISLRSSLQDSSILRAELKGEAYKDIDTESVVSQLLGKTEREAASSLSASNPGIAQMSISFWPFWVQRVPTHADRVSVTLKLD